LKNPLAYDEVPKARYTKWPSQLFIEELKRRSGERVQTNPEFHFVMEDMERLRHKLDENRITLNEDARRKEIQDEKVRKEARSKERLARHEEEPSIYRVTLDTVDKPNLQLIMYPGKLAQAKAKDGATKVSPEAAPDDDTDLIGAADDAKEPAIDPERDETLNILADLVDLSKGPKTAATNVKKSAEHRP
jgi:carboxyl-terminal processing protease